MWLCSIKLNWFMNPYGTALLAFNMASQYGKSIPLVIEVVSTNWRDDYGHKLVEYEAMGMEEYWIVDFRALGAVRYIGQPKRPTVTICHLNNGEYQLLRLISGQAVESKVLPDLKLSIDAIFSGCLSLRLFYAG